MEKDQKVAAAEEPKVDLFEDDDEFEEFNINQGKIFGAHVLVNQQLIVMEYNALIGV